MHVLLRSARHSVSSKIAGQTLYQDRIVFIDAVKELSEQLCTVMGDFWKDGVSLKAKELAISEK